jgi:hypothetical protein
MRLSKNDQELLAEAYEKIMNKFHDCECGCEECGLGCPCDKNCKCKEDKSSVK